MYTRTQMREWLAARGMDRGAIDRLYHLLDVPRRPVAFAVVLRRFLAAAETIERTVWYADAERLEQYKGDAHMILETLRVEGPDDAIVDGRVAQPRGVYAHHPLYGLLQRGYDHDALEAEYRWLHGLLLLIRPELPAGDRTAHRSFGRWCMAARAMGEAPQEDEPTPPWRLLQYLTPVLEAGADPDRCLSDMRHAARSRSRRRHAQYLHTAWRYLRWRLLRRGVAAGTGRGGPRPIRGMPAGPYGVRQPVAAEGIVSEHPHQWWTVARSADEREHDGASRAGEARADAGTPGDTYGPARGAPFRARGCYSRGQLYRSRRLQQRRASNAGQDTVLTVRVWTPAQVAAIVHALLTAHQCPENAALLRSGAGYCLIGLLTGVDQGRVDEAIVDDCRLAWRPRSIEGTVPTPPRRYEGLVRPTGRWVSVPVPGLLYTLNNAVIDQGGRAQRDRAIEAALAHLKRQTGQRVRWRHLRQHWWGRIAATTQQPCVASAMTGYVRPSTGVPLHYLYLSPQYQHHAYRCAYASIAQELRDEFRHRGIVWCSQWDACAPARPSTDQCGVGTAIVPRTDQLTSQLGECVCNAREGLGRKRASAEAVTLGLYHLITMYCGIRAVRARAAHAALFVRGYQTISDKDTPGYDKARPLALPAAVATRVRHLWECRLDHLVDTGLIDERPPMAPPVPRRREDYLEALRKAPRGGLAFIAGATRARLEYQPPTVVRRERGLDLPLPNNWHRHWLRTRLAELAIADQLANAWQGHACHGQDPWGADSCMRTGAGIEHVAEKLRPDIEPLLQQVEAINARR